MPTSAPPHTTQPVHLANRQGALWSRRHLDSRNRFADVDETPAPPPKQTSNPCHESCSTDTGNERRRRGCQRRSGCHPRQLHLRASPSPGPRSEHVGLTWLRFCQLLRTEGVRRLWKTSRCEERFALRRLPSDAVPGMARSRSQVGNNRPVLCERYDRGVIEKWHLVRRPREIGRMRAGGHTPSNSQQKGTLQ
jgi:hypothetical protein